MGKLLRRKILANALRLKYAGSLRSLRHFGLFIGYPRSGHTLVAALLDAHENMLFANGLDATEYLASNFGLWEVAALSIWNSSRFTRHGRRSNGYDYNVPNGLHGHWQRLEVIGDKSGDLFSYRLQHQPELLDMVLEKLGTMVRFVHVVRNPYDCISTMSSRGRISLRNAADEFFGLCDANARARLAIPGSQWTDIYLEELIRDPDSSIRETCRFFGQECTHSYIDSTSALIFKAPVRSSHHAQWDAGLAREVEARSKNYAWLGGYGLEQAERASGTGGSPFVAPGAPMEEQRPSRTGAATA